LKSEEEPAEVDAASVFDVAVATGRFAFMCVAIIVVESGARVAVPDCAEAVSVSIPLSAMIGVAAKKRNATLPGE
jgi:hypothetical protein